MTTVGSVSQSVSDVTLHRLITEYRYATIIFYVGMEMHFQPPMLSDDG